MPQADRSGPTGTDSGRVPAVSLDQSFDSDTLVSLRSAVAAHGNALGLAGERLELLIVVAHELASNAVRHGGGWGRLLLWRDGNEVCCRVIDDGPGLSQTDPNSWRVPPPVRAEGGRGLYFVQALADAVTVRADRTGTTVTVRFLVS